MWRPDGAQSNVLWESDSCRLLTWTEISAGSMLHREGKWCLNLLGDSPTAYDLVSQ